MSKFDRELEKRKSNNNKNWIKEYSKFLSTALSKVKETTEKWLSKAPDDQNLISSWFTPSRQRRLQKEITQDMKDELKAVEKYISDRYGAEYANAWYSKAYVTTQDGIKKGFNFKIGKTNKKVLKSRLENSLSKFMDRNAINSDRAKYISRTYRAVKTGIKNNQSLDDIYKNVDKVFGVRDRKGRLISDPTKQKGIGWEYRRVLLTEIGRIQADSEADEYVKEQSQGVNSELLYRSAFLPTSRDQSIAMDGQIANENGEFKYPDGKFYRQHNTGNPAWDINDYCFTTKIDLTFPEKYKMNKDEEAQAKTINNIDAYAKDSGLRVDKYNQIKEPKVTIKRRK